MIACMRLACRLTPEACVRRQEDARNHCPPTQCADCEQGRGVAKELGVVVSDRKSKYRLTVERLGRANTGETKPRRGTSAWSPHYEGK